MKTTIKSAAMKKIEKLSHKANDRGLAAAVILQEMKKTASVVVAAPEAPAAPICTKCLRPVKPVILAGDQKGHEKFGECKCSKWQAVRGSWERVHGDKPDNSKLSKRPVLTNAMLLDQIQKKAAPDIAKVATKIKAELKKSENPYRAKIEGWEERLGACALIRFCRANKFTREQTSSILKDLNLDCADGTLNQQYYGWQKRGGAPKLAKMENMISAAQLLTCCKASAGLFDRSKKSIEARKQKRAA